MNVWTWAPYFPTAIFSQLFFVRLTWENCSENLLPWYFFLFFVRYSAPSLMQRFPAGGSCTPGNISCTRREVLEKIRKEKLNSFVSGLYTLWIRSDSDYITTRKQHRHSAKLTLNTRCLSPDKSNWDRNTKKNLMAVVLLCILNVLSKRLFTSKNIKCVYCCCFIHPLAYS